MDSCQRGNQKLLPRLDMGRQKEMCISELLGPVGFIFFYKGAHILHACVCVCVCVCVQTQTHTHMSSSSTRVLLLSDVMLCHELYYTRFGNAFEKVLDLPWYSFRVMCSMYMRSQVLSLSFLPVFFGQGQGNSPVSHLHFHEAFQKGR